MTKTERKYWGILISGFLMLLVIHLLIPAPINWMPTFSKNDKIPYGDYILYQILPDIFPKQPIQTNNLPIYDALKDSTYQHTNFIIVNNSFSPDRYAAKKLLKYVSDGNDLFIATGKMSGFLTDTLNTESKNIFTLKDLYKNFKKDSLGAKQFPPEIFFTNPTIEADSLFKLPGSQLTFFSRIDTSRATILAKNTQNQAVFVSYKWGKGTLYLSCTPLAFTNFNLVSRYNSRFVFIALSYLPVQKTIWDEYYKLGRREAGSPLRYILSRKELSWAYFLILFTVILFVLFRGKRYQKIIPKFETPKNTSLEFIKTVSRLASYKGNHLKMAQKRINLLNIYLRSRLNINPDYTNPELPKKLSNVSGFSIEQSQSLVRALNRIQKQNNPLSVQELVSLNKIIDTFYKKTQR